MHYRPAPNHRLRRLRRALLAAALAACALPAGDSAAGTLSLGDGTLF